MKPSHSRSRQSAKSRGRPRSFPPGSTVRRHSFSLTENTAGIAVRGRSGRAPGGTDAWLGDRRTDEDSVMIRVIVADDHPVVVIGVKTVLERHGDIKVVGEACNGSELIDRLDPLPCDVIITDFSMPGDAPDELSGEGGSEPRHADGLPLITLLATRYPQIPVIVLTMLNNVAVLRAIREKGMKGLAYKKSFATDLPNAVRAVKRGDTYVSPS